MGFEELSVYHEDKGDTLDGVNCVHGSQTQTKPWGWGTAVTGKAQ